MGRTSSFRSPRRALFAALLVGAGGALLSCRSAVQPAAAPEKPVAEVTGNPFQGVEVFRAPDGFAEQAQRRLEQEGSPDAALIAKIARQPQARWFGGWSADIQTVVSNYVNAAARQGQLALLVAYNIPNRDCGQYSSGGAGDPKIYEKWIGEYAAGIGDRRAVVVLEPDALPQVAQCLNEADQAERLRLLKFAVEKLEENSGTSVYIDAGHSDWQPAEVIAERLKKAGIESARGFALNVSNYAADEELIAYGKKVIAALGLDTHFIIDSSRNGNGPAPSDDPENWCNPAGRALGRAPTAETGEPALDAFQWIKKPGESDGECKGGPAAGQWFEARALEMAKNARW